MRGLGGNDSFVVDNAGDVVIELVGNGTDTVFASVSFALQSGQEIENLQTNNAAAVTAINLTGNNLNNIITGNAGNNTLNGGLGIDTLTGLGGNDLYIVDNAGDVVVETRRRRHRHGEHHRELHAGRLAARSRCCRRAAPAAPMRSS